MSKLISDYFIDPSFSLPYVQHLAKEEHGMQRLFSKVVYSDESTIRFAEHTHHQFRLKDIPADSSGAHTVQAGSFTRGIFEVPFFAAETHLTAHKFKQPVPPELLNRNKPFSERLRRAWNIASTWADQARMMGRSIEFQAVEALFYGRLTFENTPSPDFNRDPNNNLHVAKDWSDPTADILGDLTGLADQVINHGGSPDTVIMGKKAFDGMMKNDRILKLLDIRRIEIGNIAPRMQKTGMIRCAVLFISGHPITFYQYNEQYEEPLGDTIVRKPYLDPAGVIMMDSSQELISYFGSSILLDEFKLSNHINVNGMRFDAYVFLQPPAGLTVGMQGRPFLFPTTPNFTAVLKSDGTKIA